MTRLRSLPLLSALATAALIVTLTSAPAAARTTDEPIAPELSAAASGAITGRVLVVPFGGGAPVPANDGEVKIFAAASASDTPVAFAPLSGSGTFAIAGLPAGQYRVAFSSYDTRALPVREWFNNQYDRLSSDPITLIEGAAFPFGDIVLEPRDLATERLAGPNRFSTAAAVSERYAIDGADRDIVIVNGLNFPDALSASPLATRLNAPLLMVTQNAIPAATLAELDRLDPLSITIIGSEGVVSAAVAAQLATYVGGAANVTRIAGPNRYATSRAVVDRLDEDYTIQRIFVATGRDFPDALAAGPAAGKVGGAVLLVDGSRGALDASTASFLDSMNVPVTLVGGPSVVSAGIETQLQTLGLDVERLSGPNRYVTAIAIAIEYFPMADYAYLTNGSGFADALAVGPRAGISGSPVYLTQGSCVTDAVFDDILAGLFTGVTLIGSEGVLSTRVEALEPCTTS